MEDGRWELTPSHPSRSSRDSHKKRGLIWSDLVGFTWIFADSLGFLNSGRCHVSGAMCQVSGGARVRASRAPSQKPEFCS
jgi:hypothetical protein